MTEADLFRQYAKEAMHSSSKSINEDERRNLEGLACIWAQAALTSERVLGQVLFRRRATFLKPHRRPVRSASGNRRTRLAVNFMR